MIKRLTISAVILSMFACLHAAYGQSDLDIAIAICIAEVETPKPAGQAVLTPPPAKMQRPAAVDADSLSADAQPTPWPGVSAGLNALNPKPGEVLVDFGCGADARWLIEACKFFRVEKAIGVEIDPEAAESARRHVEAAGLSDSIQIITGDATKVNVQADIGCAYLWPATLGQLRPRIEKLDRFVSYGFQVPGLSMQKKGNVYSWKRAQAVAAAPAVKRVPITRTVRQTVRLSRGSYCQVCGRHCSNPMAHRAQQQIVGYRNVPTATAQPVVRTQQPAGRWVTKKVCVNGRCSMQRVWQAY